jgi:tetratricopeptide (TPR) repeat protein/transglutaminase-like putative cysteine protease
MLRHLCFAFVAGSCVLPFVGLTAQVSPTTSESISKPSNTTFAKADYSQEAIVEEQDTTKIDFENDGTNTREISARIRIQSDAGVQRFGMLKFSYQSATESIDVGYVRVLKPDGTTIPTPNDNIQDMPAEITSQAPFYSDLREKHVAVKGLSTGDVLEMRAHWHSTKPLALGQFWYSFNFPRDFIVLHQEIQITIPRDRVIKWKSPEVKPVITEQGTRRIYSWTYSVLEHKSADEQKRQQDDQTYQLARGKLPSPDVQISTFQSWDEIGAWYNKLQLDRVKSSLEVRAKALELTKGAKDDDAKLRAIYTYVSTQFRYIGVAFGIGRYQPHAASEVLANQYGDCKDKHTLLASLLEAAGIQAYPALINSTHTLDPDVPSPSQFDHVVTAVPRGNGFDWLDTTAEVAPYGYLLSPLWDKQALVIPTDKAATLITTPAELSTMASETFRIDARLKDNGTLEGKVERTMSGGDTEVLLRTVFRRTPMQQWKDIVQQISYGSGFSGEVSDVTASSPEKIDEPFHFSYSYTRKDYPQWSERRISSPLPPMTGIIPNEEPNHPILLSGGELRYQSRVELPKGYSPQLPARIDLSEKFAEYHAAYTIEDGVLHTERRLLVKAREVPANQYDGYKKFFETLSADHDVYVGLQQRHITPASYEETIWTLPYSDNHEAAKAYDDAREQYNRGDTAAEIESLKRATQVDLKFIRAWLWLGQIYMYNGRTDSALDALRSAIENDPQQLLSYKGLGFALMRLKKYDDAISAWQRLIAIAPDDPDGPANLGSTFSAVKRYSDAVSAFESATKLSPDSASLYVQLGTAYIRAGSEDKALAVYKKALETTPTPGMYNDVGYELAEANKQLPLALRYAEKAVRDEEEASTKVNFAELKDLRYSSSLAAYWDTLGWVYFRMGVYDKAESYLNSAWQAGQEGVVADHLGQLYEKEHKLPIALHMYNLALAANPRLEDTPARMRNLAHVPLPKNRMSAGEELGLMRTIKLPAITRERVTAYFDVLIAGSKIEKAHFVSGSELLGGAGDNLEKSAFAEAFPPNSTAHLFRRGVLTCSEISCSFVLYPLSLTARTN